MTCMSVCLCQKLCSVGGEAAVTSKTRASKPRAQHGGPYFGAGAA